MVIDSDALFFVPMVPLFEDGSPCEFRVNRGAPWIFRKCNPRKTRQTQLRCDIAVFIEGQPIGNRSQNGTEGSVSKAAGDQRKKPDTRDSGHEFFRSRLQRE